MWCLGHAQTLNGDQDSDDEDDDDDDDNVSDDGGDECWARQIYYGSNLELSRSADK